MECNELPETIWKKIDEDLTRNAEEELQRSAFAWEEKKQPGGSVEETGNISAFTGGQFSSLRAVFRLLNNSDGHGAILADDVGLGKTRVALEAVRRVVNESRSKRVAIIVPNPLFDQWIEEMQRSSFCVLRKGHEPLKKRNSYVDCLALRCIDDLIKGEACVMRDKKLSDRALNARIVLLTQNLFAIRTGLNTRRDLKNDARWGYYWDFCSALSKVREIDKERHGRGKRISLKRETQGWLEKRIMGRGSISPKGGDETHASLDDFVPPKGPNDAIKAKVKSLFLSLTAILLGSFDMIVIDEAHKGRGAIADSSDKRTHRTALTTLVQSLYRRKHCRVLAMTATPVDIDSTGKGWCQILDRIDVPADHQKSLEKTIDKYLEDLEALQTGPEGDATLLKNFNQSQKAFASVMKHYLIRRLKNDHISRSNLDRKQLIVKPTDAAWAKAICEAEALSFVCGECDADENDSRERRRQAQRLRLTIGNGHGISRLLASAAPKTKEESEQDKQFVQSMEQGCAKDWLVKLQKSLTSAQKKLHPAIYAVAKEIDENKEFSDEKILVFGYYISPIRQLVDLLNVRFYIKQYRSDDKSRIPAGTVLTGAEALVLKRLQQQEKDIPSQKELNRFLNGCNGSRANGRNYACALCGDVEAEERAAIQKAFNKENCFPRVLVAQTQIGSEGLNLHKQCSVVIFLHPDWNPRVLEQGIGRVNRIGSLWERRYREYKDNKDKGGELPHPIAVREVVFEGTYDEENWRILGVRWRRMRAFLDGEISADKTLENPFDPETILKTDESHSG